MDNPFLDEYFSVIDVDIDGEAFWYKEDFPDEDLEIRHLFKKIAHKLMFKLKNRITNHVYLMHYGEIPKSQYLMNEMLKIFKRNYNKPMKVIRRL